eukprot:TCONS_00027822-protein
MDVQLLSQCCGATLILLALICIVLNGLLILAIIKDPVKKLQRLSNYLLVHLIVCDMAVGLIGTPFTAYATFKMADPQNVLILNIFKAASIISFYAEFLTTIFLAYDRYRAIENPFKHRANARLALFVKYTVAIWVLSVALTIDNFFRKFLPVFGVVKLISFVAILILSLSMIYFRTRNVLSKRGADKEQPLLTGGENTRIREESKQAISLLTMILACQMLTLIVLASTEIFFTVNTHKASLQDRQIADVIRYFMIALNSIFNAVICFIKMSDFRTSLKSLICSH